MLTCFTFHIIMLFKVNGKFFWMFLASHWLVSFEKSMFSLFCFSPIIVWIRRLVLRYYHIFILVSFNLLPHIAHDVRSMSMSRGYGLQQPSVPQMYSPGKLRSHMSGRFKYVCNWSNAGSEKEKKLYIMMVRRLRAF